MVEDTGAREEITADPIDVDRLVGEISSQNPRTAHAAVHESRYACSRLCDEGQKEPIKRVLDAVVASLPNWGSAKDLADEALELKRSCEEYLVKLGTLPELLANLDSGDLFIRDWAFGEIRKRADNDASRADLSSIQRKLETAPIPVSNWGALNTYSLAGLKAFCRRRLGPYGKEDVKPNPMRNPPSGQPTTPPPQKAAR